MKKNIAKFGFVLGALVALTGVQQAQAATNDTTALTLDIEDYASISATASLTVTPDLDDIMDDVTTEVGGIELTIDSTSGAKITWAGSGDGTAGTIKASDITLSSDGTDFVAGDDTTALYTSTDAQQAVNVPIDVKISNLQDYTIGDHTSTLYFAIVAN